MPVGANMSVRDELLQRVATLEKEVSALEGQVAGLVRDREDLTARLNARRNMGAPGQSPAIDGVPAVLSGARGDLLADRRVPLWDTPGGPMSGAKVVARVVNGFPVRIVSKKRVAAQDWVQCYTYHLTPNSIGWVASSQVRAEQDSFPSQNEG